MIHELLARNYSSKTSHQPRPADSPPVPKFVGKSKGYAITMEFFEIFAWHPWNLACSHLHKSLPSLAIDHSMLLWLVRTLFLLKFVFRCTCSSPRCPKTRFLTWTRSGKRIGGNSSSTNFHLTTTTPGKSRHSGSASKVVIKSTTYYCHHPLQ